MASNFDPRGPYAYDCGADSWRHMSPEERRFNEMRQLEYAAEAYRAKMGNGLMPPIMQAGYGNTLQVQPLDECQNSAASNQSNGKKRKVLLLC